MIKVATYSKRWSVSSGCEWKGEEGDLDDEQLLANSGPHSLFRGLDRPHGQNVHVNCQAHSNQEVPVNDRESLFNWPASQAHVNPPVPKPLSSAADLLAEQRKIWFNEPS